MLTKPDDRAVLVQFDNVILQLVPLTDSVITLEHGLAYLSQSHSDYRSRAEADQLANLRDHMNFPARFGGTHLFDAICAVSKIELGNQMGRRAMVILTDGGDNGSQFNLKDAIRAAQGADIMIYSVYYSNGGGNLDVLQDLSKATGGRVFTVSPTSSLQQIYADIAADLRLEYQIGYAPPDLRPNRYHKIDLRTADNTLIVQAREGYFTPK
jgi:Ca-activated chloride channel family protein